MVFTVEVVTELSGVPESCARIGIQLSVRAAYGALSWGKQTTEHLSARVMTRQAERPSVHIELIPALPEQELVLANLLELAYAHDFSEFHDLVLGTDGRFGYKYLPLYWSEPDRYPFLVRMDGNLAGLALVKRGSEISDDESVWDMAEFSRCSWVPKAWN